MDVSLGRVGVALVLGGRICAHFLLHHESVEFDAWLLKTSTVCGIIDAGVLELFLDFESLSFKFSRLFSERWLTMTMADEMRQRNSVMRQERHGNKRKHE